MAGSHGGKRAGAGRPRKDGVVRDAVFSVRVSKADLELLRRAGAGEWAREVLLRAAKMR